MSRLNKDVMILNRHHITWIPYNLKCRINRNAGIAVVVSAMQCAMMQGFIRFITQVSKWLQHMCRSFVWASLSQV